MGVMRIEGIALRFGDCPDEKRPEYTLLRYIVARICKKYYVFLRGWRFHYYQLSLLHRHSPYQKKTDERKTAVSKRFTSFVIFIKQAKALVKVIHHISKSMSPHVPSGWFPFFDGDSISDGMREFERWLRRPIRGTKNVKTMWANEPF